MISEQFPQNAALPERSVVARPAAPSALDRTLDLSRLNVEWVLYGVLFLASVLIHMWNLGHMALAHDEGVVSYMSWKFFTGRGGFTCAGGVPNDTYCYDPVYHGPTQYVLQFASFFLFGVSDWSARLPMALAIIGLVPMCWLLRPIVGKRVAFLSALLLTLSPSLVYYSRYARHDALMVLWVMFLAVGLFRWIESGRIAELALAAAGLALAWATHELVFIVGFIGVTFLLYRWLWEYRPRWFAIGTAIALAIGTAITVATIVAGVTSAANAKAPGLTPAQITAAQYPYKVMQRLLGPGLLLGIGAPLTWLLSRSWEPTPVLSRRLGLTWNSRGNAAADSRPKTVWGALPATLWWATGSFLLTFALLFTTFFAYPRGFFDGFYQGLKYWLGSQHDYARGDQPWFYYFMLLPVYELLALVSALGGIVALFFKRRRRAFGHVAVGHVQPDPIETTQYGEAPVEVIDAGRERRFGQLFGGRVTQKLVSPNGEPWDGNGDGVANGHGTAASLADDPAASNVHHLWVPFTLYWAVLSFIAYSWAGEKMPWLLIHTALPLTLYAAAVLASIVEHVDWRRARAERGWAVPVLVTIAIITALVGLFFVSGAGSTAGNTLQGLQTRLRAVPALVVMGAAVVGLVLLSQRLGGRNMLRLAALTLAGLFLLYGVRALTMVVYDHPDTPIEPLIYTQTSPDVPRLVDVIQQTAYNQGRNERSTNDPTGSHTIKIVVDNELAWPFQWYLRDFGVTWTEQTNNKPLPPEATDAAIVLLHTSNATQEKRDQLAETHVKYAEAVFNWWFPEGGTVPDPRDPAKQVRAYKELRKDNPFAVMAWPFRPDNWPGLAKFMLYREVPHKLEGRDLEMYMRIDTAPVAGGVQTQPQPKIAVSPLTSSRTFGAGELNTPRGIAVDAQGNAYVADAKNNRIVVYDPTGKQLRAFGTAGNGEGQFLEPSGVSFDVQGNVYVADTWNARVQKLTLDGKFIKAWGSGRDDFGDGKRATDTNGDLAQNQANPLGFYGPRNLIVIGDRVYIADTGNKRIVVTDLDGNYVEQFGTWGKTAGQFWEPIGLGKDAQNQLYVADTWNGRVQVFARDAQQHTNPAPVRTFAVRGWSANTYNDPFMTVLPDGRVICAVPERGELSVFDAAGTLTARLKDPQTAAPHGMAVTPDGQVLVVDGSGHVGQFRVP